MKSSQLVTIHDHQAVTTSQTITEHFGKQHYHVRETIRRIAEQCPSEFSATNFRCTSYTDVQGKLQPAYELTRDAFTLVAMSFTGEKALQFKLAYIAAFNRMEETLHKQGQREVLATLDQAHDVEETLKAELSSLKEELLDTYRSQIKLLAKPKRKVTPNRPVTSADMQQMRTYAAQGMSTEAIAKKMQRSRATVFYALQGAMGKSVDQQPSLFGKGVTA
ncbi:MAG: Rha family transcriptional regulator [Burkholderiaceae bacterium]|nr:Rha family transcriptional regulator [Burkholderiaceae bacterium]